MKKINYFLIINTLLIMCGVWTAQAGGPLEITSNLREVDDCHCVNANSSGTYTFTVAYPFGATSMADIETVVWEAYGGVEIESTSDMSVSVKIKQGETYADRFHKYSKARLKVMVRAKDSIVLRWAGGYCNGPGTWEDSLVLPPYITEFHGEVDICKEFAMPVGANRIVGPMCVLPNDTVTYSVAPWVTLSDINRAGVDKYFWSYSDGLQANNTEEYYSADGSSTTFTASNVDSALLSVVLGACNEHTQTPLLLNIMQDAADPIFNKNPDNYCMAFNTEVDTFIVANPQKGVTYEWDLRSWMPPVYISEAGDTIVFKPLNNAQTIRMNMLGSCSEKKFIYDINRSITSSDTITTAYGNCLPADKDIQFYMNAVPDGTEMKWKVESGTGWSIAPDQANKARPIIHVGNGPGVISARTASCGQDSVVFSFTVLPAIPDSISGNVCLNQGDTTEQAYFIEQLLNATSYEWEIPNNWSIKENTSTNGNSIIVIPDGNSGGAIRVRAIGCDTTDWSSPLLIGLNPVAPVPVLLDSCINAGLPDVITLKAALCINGLDYHWIVPSELGSLSSYSNPNDVSEIRINTIGTTGEFYVKVYAENQFCGESSIDSILIDINKSDLPYTIVEITNPLITTSRYEINPSDIDFSWFANHSFEWILENANNKQNVTDPNAAYSTITGLPKGLLQTNGLFYLTVTDKTTGCQTRKTSSLLGLRSLEVNYKTMPERADVIIAPNPVSSTLTVKMPQKMPVRIVIYSLDGKVIKTISEQTGIVQIDVSRMMKGAYFLVAEQDGERYIKKIIKE